MTNPTVTQDVYPLTMNPEMSPHRELARLLDGDVAVGIESTATGPKFVLFHVGTPYWLARWSADGTFELNSESYALDFWMFREDYLLEKTGEFLCRAPQVYDRHFFHEISPFVGPALAKLVPIEDAPEKFETSLIADVYPIVVFKELLYANTKEYYEHRPPLLMHRYPEVALKIKDVLDAATAKFAETPRED